jgi:hypothetical protein
MFVLSFSKSEVSVINADGRQIFYAVDRRTRDRIHVLIENNPSKLAFISPFSVDSTYYKKGFRMRYFVFNGNDFKRFKILYMLKLINHLASLTQTDTVYMNVRRLQHQLPNPFQQILESRYNCASLANV